MIVNIIAFSIVIMGLAASAVLFYRFPRLTAKTGTRAAAAAVSVIIPARNEENNLGLLLGDLKRQSFRPLEIICVDDASEDGTAAVARTFETRLLSITSKPEGWVGKSWACQCGSEAARGDLLLFLDADVRLGRHGIARLISAFTENRGTISVQPCHQTEKNYEQLSLIFNLVQVAANGTCLPKKSPLGLYGPVILVSRADYGTLGGHAAVKDSIVEDLALGQQLRKSGLPYDVFIGDEDIAFRMYGGGLQSLLDGWTKNIAAAAAKTAPPVFLLVFFWISSIVSAPLYFTAALFTGKWSWALLYGAAYMAWAVLLFVLSKKIGRFSLWASVFFPIPMAAFIGVFLVSAVKKICHLKIRWKGRDIPAEAKRCD